MGRRARSLFAVACIASAGCGAKVHDRGLAPVRPPPPAEDAAVPPAPPPPEPLPSLESLAAKQVRVAPGMRELLRGEATGALVLPKPAHDACLRLTFAAHDPVTLRLLDRDGAVLATTTSKAGELAGRGPVCIHAGTEARVEMAGDAGSVRYVVWAAP